MRLNLEHGANHLCKEEKQQDYHIGKRLPETAACANAGTGGGGAAGAQVRLVLRGR